MASYQPSLGDRVRFKRDLGGYLKAGRIGIVWTVDPESEPGVVNDFPVLVLIPWIREEAPVDAEPWNGQLGAKSVFLGQFQKSPAIPMRPSELEYIDSIVQGNN